MRLQAQTKSYIWREGDSFCLLQTADFPPTVRIVTWKGSYRLRNFSIRRILLAECIL